MSSVLNPITRTPFPQSLALVAGAYTAQAGQMTNVRAGGGAVTVKAPAAPIQAMVFAVIDGDGSAGAQPITIDGNGHQIDGQASETIAVANDCGVFVYDAGQWRSVIPTRAVDGADGVLEYEGPLTAGKASSANPSFTGSTTWTGTRFTIRGIPAEAQTTAAGAALLASIAVPDEQSLSIDFIGSMKGQTGVAKGGTFKGAITYQRTGGAAPVLVGAAVYATPQVTTAGDDMTFGAPAGNTIPINVNAAGVEGRNWSAEIRVAAQAATP